MPAQAQEVDGVEVTLAGKSFLFVEKSRAGKPTTKRPVPRVTSWLEPDFTSNAQVGIWVTALLDEADSKAGGSAVKLLERMLGDYLVESSAPAFNKDGTVSEEKIVPGFTEAQGKGLTEKEINAQIAALQGEMSQLMELLEYKGTPKMGQVLADAGFTDVTFAQRCQAVKNKHKDLTDAILEINEKKDARAKSKAENAAKNAAKKAAEAKNAPAAETVAA